MSQEQARRALEHSRACYALAQVKRLQLAETDTGGMGVTATSVEAEQHWRTNAPWYRKVLRLLSDLVSFL
jgi:hypothetical protein